MKDAQIDSETICRVRDLFIFQAYTGISYADLAKFNFKRDVQKRGNKYVILDIRLKTEENYFIVLLSPAMEILKKYDVIVAPAAPTTAPELGKSLSDPIKMYLGDIYTISVNLAGLPGITIPVGKDSKGLPVGMQLIGNCFEENKIIQTAYTFEQTKAYEAPELAKEDR